jgi:hypothetical protein
LERAARYSEVKEVEEEKEEEEEGYYELYNKIGVYF